MLAGERLLGAVMLENHERDNAFGPAELQLLQTVASSMGVALLNAKSYEAERQRAAELAIINAVQQALAGKLDIQGVYDVVGDKLREVFPRSFEGIRIVDRAAGQMLFPYGMLDGKRVHPAPRPLDDRGLGAEVIRTGRTLLVDEDIDAVVARFGNAGRVFGDRSPRSLLLVPLVVAGQVQGMVALNDMEREHAFRPEDVRLLETLAASMSLALENVRLFNETREALEQQTATANVLKVLSQSPTDVQPVFDAIVESALALCDARIGGVGRFDGELVHLAAFHGASPEGVAAMRAGFPMKPSRASILARTVLEGAPVHIHDVLEDPDYALKDATVQIGYRSNLAVPLIRDGNVIGAIGVCREEPSYFPEKHVRLLQIFADQAVIAIENVRLFNETREALERQTATATILRAISRSPGDVQPVFEAIATSAYQPLDRCFTGVLRRDGEGFRLVAMLEGEQALSVPDANFVPFDPQANFPSRVFASGEMLHIPDWSAIELPAHEQRVHSGLGVSSSLMLPLLRDGECVAVLFVGRHQQQAFT